MNAMGMHDVPVFVVSVLLLNLTPGPDTAFIVGRSIAQGRRAGMLSALGIGLGCCVHALAAALGLSALVAASPTAFAVIQYMGAAYLIWLGVRLVLGSGAAKAVAHAPVESGPVTAAPTRADPWTGPRIFWQAFFTNVLNPKVVFFFLSFFPQFIDVHAESRTLGLGLLGVLFVVISTAYNSTLAWTAGTLTARLRRQASVQQWLMRLTGAAFVAIGFKLALSRPA